MSREKYQCYEGRYNRSTAPVAVNDNHRWTSTDDQRLMVTWCRSTTTIQVRLHVSKTLGRSYVACAKRHLYLHKLYGDQNSCRGNLRQRR